MKVTRQPERNTLTALAGAARSSDPASREAAEFALRARELADANRVPADHATKLYGAKK